MRNHTKSTMTRAWRRFSLAAVAGVVVSVATVCVGGVALAAPAATSAALAWSASTEAGFNGYLPPTEERAATEPIDSVPAECVSVALDDDWGGTRCLESSDQVLVERTFSLKALESKNDIDRNCPTVDGTIFRLTNQDLSPGRAVPRGVEVTETGGVGVSALVHFDTDDFANGVRSLSMTNWTLADRDVKVVLHCTSEPTQWYR